MPCVCVCCVSAVCVVRRREERLEGIDSVRENTIDAWINWTLFLSVQGLLPIHSGGNRGEHRYW